MHTSSNLFFDLPITKRNILLLITINLSDFSEINIYEKYVHVGQEFCREPEV